MQTVVLNADLTYLNTVDWKRGIKLIIKEKAVALKEADRKVCNFEKTFVMNIPLVLKLVEMVSIVYKNKVPFSKRSVFVRDRHTCQYCGSKNKLSVDHVIPTSRGGKTSFLNCVACCTPCNLKKGHKTLEEAQMKLKKAPHEPSVMEFLIYKMKSIGAYQFLKDLEVY